MTKFSLLLPATAVLLASLALTPGAMAASAHNLQTGAHTSNTNDSLEDALAKQAKQEAQAASRAPWNSLR